MNERDFDKIFKDNIGDELSFDFQPGDWQSAAQELDKVLPVAPAAPVIAPQPRLLTWHKWAAAAAVVFVASQTWLLAKLFDLKSEIKTLKSDNTAVVSSTQPSTITETKTIVKYDTIVRTVVVDKQVSANNTQNAVAESTTTKQEKVSSNSEIYQQVYKDAYRQVRKEMGKELATTKAALAEALKKTPQLEQPNSGLADNKKVNNNSTDKNNINQNVADKGSKGNNVDNNKNNLKESAAGKDGNNNSIAQKNEKVNDKTTTPNNLEDKTAENVALYSALNRQLGDFNEVKGITAKSVVSNNKPQLWMDEDAMDALSWARHRTIIKPISLPSNWSIGINALGVWTKFPIEKYVFNKGWNVRLTYDLKNSVRLSADVDTWTESFERRDTGNHQPMFQLPPNYVFNKSNYSASIMQIRLGADYVLKNKSIFTPYIGAGLTYKKYSKKEFEYSYTNPQKEPVTFKEPFDKDRDKYFADGSNPYFLSLRAGVNTSILKRLSLNTGVTGQWRMNSVSNQRWSAQLGLVYNL